MARLTAQRELPTRWQPKILASASLPGRASARVHPAMRAHLARGRFLAFLNATDTVPRHAYASLVGSLRRTGSDFAAGSVRTVIRGRIRRPPWATVTHDLDRPAQTLGEFPSRYRTSAPPTASFAEASGTPTSEAFRIRQTERRSRSSLRRCRRESSTSSRQSAASSTLGSSRERCYLLQRRRASFTPASTGTVRPGAWCATPSMPKDLGSFGSRADRWRSW